MRKQLIQQVANKLAQFGYNVYVSGDGRHGFYTDGKRVVSFGGHWDFFVDFSGNYGPKNNSGTGWGIAKERTDITEDEAKAYITANAPEWTGNSKNTSYTTPEQHLAMYGKSSDYQKHHAEC